MAAPLWNVYLGTETGLLKGVNVVKDCWKNLNEVSKPDKSNEIRSMTWTGEDEANICVGLRNKRVGHFDTEQQRFGEFIFFDGGTGDLKNVFQTDDVTVTALDSGIVNVWQNMQVVHSIETTKVGGNLSCMEHSNVQTNVIGTGGKDSDLKLWDLNDPTTPVFQAKNVKNDWLNLQVPIWVTGIGFLMDKKIVTSTGYHKVRVYDPSAQRRPVLDMTWEEYPITAMTLYRENQVIVGNTQGSMGLLDIRKGKLVHLFKGFAGSIRCVKCHVTQPVVASCGLDRIFRVHDINSRELLHKKYMKSRLNCLLLNNSEWTDKQLGDNEDRTVVDEISKKNQTDDSGDVDNEDDDVWEQLELVKTRMVRKTDTDEPVIKKQKKDKSDREAKIEKNGKKISRKLKKT